MAERGRGRGYGWAAAAGANAAMAAVIAKAVSTQFDWRLRLLCYLGVVFFNVVMWSCYVNSLKSLTSLQATVTNFATNFLVSGLIGSFLFREALHIQWFAGAFLIVLGTLVLSKSTIEPEHGSRYSRSSPE